MYGQFENMGGTLGGIFKGVNKTTTQFSFSTPQLSNSPNMLLGIHCCTCTNASHGGVVQSPSTGAWSLSIASYQYFSKSIIESQLSYSVQQLFKTLMISTTLYRLLH